MSGLSGSEQAWGDACMLKDIGHQALQFMALRYTLHPCTCVEELTQDFKHQQHVMLQSWADATHRDLQSATCSAP